LLELISVVIPVYNTSKFLKKCLDSIINQSYNNLEIIIINDASTDNSSEIINEYALKDNRIKSIINKDNMGWSEARNIGINKATGDYITFIDSDDFISFDSIEILYTSLKDNNVNLAIPQYILFDIKSKHFYKDSYHNNNFFINDLNEIKLVNKNHLLNNLVNINVSVFKLYNLKIIKDNNIYFPKNLTFEDSVFFYMFLLHDNKTEVLYANTAVYFYIQNNSAITQNNSKFVDIMKINKLVKDLFIKHNLYDKYYNSINYYLCNHILYWGLTGKNNSLNRDITYFKEASNFLNQEIDNNYLNNILKHHHRFYYNKLKKIKHNYKSFYYKMLLKDIYKQSIFSKIIKLIKLIIKIIGNLSINKIIKISSLLFKIFIEFISSIPKLTYKIYKN